MTRLKADSLMHKLVDEITAMILDGGMSVGDRLPSMAELGERFGVSYTVLREALRVLEARGMVEIQHGKGTVVTLDPTEAMTISFRSIGRMHEKPRVHLMEVRSILEVEIARLAAMRRNDKDLHTLQELINALGQSLGDPEAFIEADTGFHYALVEATHNPLLVRIMQSLRQVQRYQWEATTRMRANDLQEAYDVHRLVFEGVRDGDPEAAGEAMHLLLDVARKDLQALMAKEMESLRDNP